MRRLVLTLTFVVLGLAAKPAQAQFTTVTANVTDPNGQLYAGGTYTVQFVDPGTSGQLPRLNGSPFQQVYAGLVIDAFGNLSVSLPDNNVIASSSGATGTQWRISICSAQYSIPTVQKYCFSYQTTITGASMNLTSALHAVAAVLPLAQGAPCTSLNGSVQYANGIVIGCTTIVYTPLGTGGCKTEAGTCASFEMPNNSDFCIEGFITSDAVSSANGNSASLCSWRSSSAGSVLFVASTTSSTTGNGIIGACSSISTSNVTLPCIYSLVEDDPNDTATGQHFIAFNAQMALNRASGSISSMEGLRVPSPISYPSGGAPGAETVTSFYGVHVYDLLNKGTTTAALKIENQTTGGGAITTGVGPNVFGDKVTGPDFISSSPNPAATGYQRLASGDVICWRNNANSGDLCLSKNTSDALLFNGVGFPQTSSANTWTALQTFNSGISSSSIKDTGLSASLPVCTDGSMNLTSTCTPTVAVITTKNLASNVSVTASTLTTIDSITVTTPMTGGPWRILSSINYYKTGGTTFACYTTDGTNIWGMWEQVVASNVSMCSSTQYSTVTYANNTAVTITEKIQDNGTSTIQTVDSILGNHSSMQVAVMSSN